jgi:hypothetical protein
MFLVLKREDFLKLFPNIAINALCVFGFTTVCTIVVFALSIIKFFQEDAFCNAWVISVGRFYAL